MALEPHNLKTWEVTLIMGSGLLMPFCMQHYHLAIPRAQLCSYGQVLGLGAH